ncbi:ABC transporter permease [Demequina sp. SYSU T00039]|uniref:ABC transporter permease n=1 Tax=Demequina lignilytica TaxID=3051663 RepID=A0AAW7M0U5_9MICO|nr:MULTISPECIES: ABC transporter permease subunit [unclassified Demequina]MDN4479232.1 ABC transporter permease [Demequina sp. SYSU T00039-1]MDN4487909.1 ABC transporter permease [Demequina sp. SYSU T00039]MDN4491715.1 ABC transporter permease [Demequina sp. SYSU T00068]
MTAIDISTGETRQRGAWRPSLSGILLVAQLELRQRIRSTRWKWALAVFVALVGAVTLLLESTVGGEMFYGGPGDVVFGVLVFFVLFLGLLVSPTLSATSINGDNKDGTLAPLQVTALSAIEIVLGKLLAAWAASLAFLALSIPFMVWGFVGSGAPVGAVIVTVLVLAVELLVVCAIGLGWSAIASRTAASAVLSYVSVATLSVLTLVFFGLSFVLVSEPTTVRYYDQQYYYDETGQAYDSWTGERVDDPTADGCTFREETWDQPHTERTWWLLAANPFVIVADAAPSNDVVSDSRYESPQTMLGSIKYAVRSARLGPETVVNYCYGYDSYEEPELLPEELERRERLAGLSAVWPWGLAFHGLLAAGAIVLAVRRLEVPHGRLSPGTRVA